jgi:hypothetical protein
MAYVYILRNGDEDVFKIGRTKSDLEKTIKQLSRGNPKPLTIYDSIVTDEEIAGETYLHRKLRSQKIVESGGREFFRISTTELGAAIQDAREYLADFIQTKRVADELCASDDDGSTVTPTEQDLDIYRSLCMVREEEDSIGAQRQFYESKLKMRINRASALGKIATWKVQTSLRLDQTVLQREMPDVFQAFQRPTRSRVFRLK